MSNRTRILAWVTVAGALALAQESADWQAQVRVAAGRKDFEAAGTLVETRLRVSPQDLEAQVWKARLLAWKGAWPQAESEYRTILQGSPRCTEAVAGLSDVLVWQDRLAEALAVLDAGRTSLPENPEILNRRARVLSRLHRGAEARQDFRAVLQQDRRNVEAREGLALLPVEYRHELRLGSDTDRFNYTDPATAQAVTLTSRWNPRWTTSFSSIAYQRFGARAERMTARVIRNVGTAAWLAVGGGAAHDVGVIPKRELALEVGRGFRISRTGALRGVELAASQQWFWFQGSKAMVISGSSLWYLPRDCTFSLNLSAARTGFHLPEIEWRPSGSARLSFPLHSSRLRGQLSFAVGSENFAKADELAHFSARTFGSGLRYQLTRTQDIGGYFAYQDRSQARTQSSVGFSYGIRF